MNPSATFALARQFQTVGLPLAEAFSFMSGLYFRGKIAYARRFASDPALVRIITSNGGLWSPERGVGPPEMVGFGQTEIAADDRVFREPYRRDVTALALRLGRKGSVVLLGSVATPKYREVLVDIFGERALFPADFVGRGDMSRGALLLRAVHADRELTYAAIVRTPLTGRRARPAGETKSK